MLMYLQAGTIDFAALTTHYFEHNDTGEDELAQAPTIKDIYAARWFQAHAARKALLDRTVNGSMQASPKSMYRLADKMGLDDLKNKAKKAYLSMITPEVSDSALCSHTPAGCTLTPVHHQ